MDCMSMMGGMGGFMALVLGIQWLLFLVLAALGIAALLKYLRAPGA